MSVSAALCVSVDNFACIFRFVRFLCFVRMHLGLHLNLYLHLLSTDSAQTFSASSPLYSSSVKPSSLRVLSVCFPFPFFLLLLYSPFVRLPLCASIHCLNLFLLCVSCLLSLFLFVMLPQRQTHTKHTEKTLAPWVPLQCRLPQQSMSTACTIGRCSFWGLVGIFHRSKLRWGPLVRLCVAGRYAPLKERMQRLKQPQTVEVLLRLLVQSRCSTTAISGEKPDNPWAHFVETRPQDLHRASTVSASRHPLPLQLLAASASLGRPLHRYLANLTRWKQQQLLLRQARDPPLEDFLSKRRNNELQPMRFNRGLSLSGTFATPQQRMKAALERLADRGLLGLPRTLTALGKPAEGASVGLGMHSLPNPFKAILPIIR